MSTLCRLWASVKYVGGYHGLLSGVTVRPGSVEPHSVVECLYACREGLDFGDLETLGSGMKVMTQGTLLHRSPVLICNNSSVEPWNTSGDFHPDNNF